MVATRGDFNSENFEDNVQQSSLTFPKETVLKLSIYMDHLENINAMPKPLTVWITSNWGKFLNRWEYQTTLPAY